MLERRGAVFRERTAMTIQAVLIDFGGVIAEEGFREGLRAVGARWKLDPDAFFKTADALILTTGYLTGKVDEGIFWNAVREKTGIPVNDATLRAEILKRFVIRPAMLAFVDRARSAGIQVAMLSDQTNWLEEIDRNANLYGHFDRVFNSFRTGKSKHDASVFRDVCSELGVAPERALFIDDNIGHIKRARGEGLQTIHYTNSLDFEEKLKCFIA
jgi:putative hydrolase of the HAD superfamily